MKKCIHFLAAAACLTCCQAAAARIEGRVVDMATGQPVAGAIVAVVGRPESRTRADLDGSFLIEASAGGTCTVRVFKAGYQPLDIAANTTASSITVDAFIARRTQDVSPVTELAPAKVTAYSIPVIDLSRGLDRSVASR